ncbi:MAG: ABC transporter substrate-binding protein [Dehalococcoidia bacterium]
MTAFLAACGGSDDGDTAQSAATSTSGQSTTSAGSGGAPSDLVVANELEAEHLGPFWRGYPQQLVARQIWESMAVPRMTLDQSGVGQVTFKPLLVESWEQIEPVRWRLTLRPGVTFHNGEPWNAQAAKFAFDTFTDKEAMAKLNQTASLATYISGATVLDDMTVEVQTQGPQGEFLQRVVSGVIAIPPKATEQQGIQSFYENPIGTGPFTLKIWQRGQEIRLEKNPAYWDATATNIPAIRYLFRSEPSVRTQMIKANEAQFAYNIGIEQAQGLKNVVTGGGFQSNSVRTNNQKPVTGDIRVRTAMNYAVDRDAVIKTVFRGKATPIGFFGFQPVDVKPFQYKPDEAKKLIDAAGARGQTLEFVWGELRIPEEPQLAEIYKAAFEAIGLKIDLKRVEPKVYDDMNNRPFPVQPHMFMETTSSGNGGEIVGGLRDKYGCKGTGSYCNEAFDAAFTDLSATLDPAERDRKLQDIAYRLQWEETPRVWVAAVQQVHAFAESIQANLPANLPFLFTDLKFA